MTSLFKYWEKDFNKKDFLKNTSLFYTIFIFELKHLYLQFCKYF